MCGNSVTFIIIKEQDRYLNYNIYIGNTHSLYPLVICASPGDNCRWSNRQDCDLLSFLMVCDLHKLWFAQVVSRRYIPILVLVVIIIQNDTLFYLSNMIPCIIYPKWYNRSVCNFTIVYGSLWLCMVSRQDFCFIWIILSQPFQLTQRSIF